MLSNYSAYWILLHNEFMFHFSMSNQYLQQVDDYVYKSIGQINIKQIFQVGKVWL
jgi:hypothetical protein